MSFDREIRSSRDRGSEAFLTNELEDRLRTFVEFLLASLHVVEIKRSAEIGYHVRIGGVAFSETKILELSGKRAVWLQSPKLSMNLMGMGITYEAETVLSAPLDSVEFNKRFVLDSSEIRILVKEVTLGGKPRDTSAK